MFRTNNTHLQDDLFNHYQTMKPSIAKMLEKSWAPVFYKEVFCKINEEIYAPLYCLDNGRPNTPVNILLSLEIIKHQFGFTDEEILEQFYFDFQILYALGGVVKISSVKKCKEFNFFNHSGRIPGDFVYSQAKRPPENNKGRLKPPVLSMVR